MLSPLAKPPLTPEQEYWMSKLGEFSKSNLKKPLMVLNITVLLMISPTSLKHDFMSL